MPKKMKRFVPRDDDDQTLHEVIKITGETTEQFRVMWAGDDPNTGKPWKQSLVPKDDCTDDIVNAWNMEKRARARESRLRRANNSVSVPPNHTLPVPTTTKLQEVGNTDANSLSNNNSPAQPRNRTSRIIANTLVRKALPNDNNALSNDLGSPANNASRLSGVKLGPLLRTKQTIVDRDSTDVEMQMDISKVKIGPPSRKKRTILDHNSMDDAEMQTDISNVKIGPPSRKKQKKQDCTSRTITGSIDSLTSSTNDSHTIITTRLSPASTKRLADFDRDVLMSNSDDLSACKVNGSQAEEDVELALETDGKEGTQGSKPAHEQEQFESTFEANIDRTGTMGDISPSVIEDSEGTRIEISSDSPIVMQSGTTAIPIELSKIAKIFGVYSSSSSENAIVVLANQSSQATPTDTTINMILDLRLRASLAAGDIICITITRWGGFRLIWIKLRSPDNAQRFRRAALNHGASFFCEHVHPDLYNAASSSPDAYSKEWLDPKGPRRKRKKKARLDCRSV